MAVHMAGKHNGIVRKKISVKRYGASGKDGVSCYESEESMRCCHKMTMGWLDSRKKGAGVRRFSIVLLGAAFLLSSCVSVSFNKLNMWEDPKIADNAGSLTLLNDGSTALIPCKFNNYSIKATLKCGSKERQVVLMVDTGSIANLLSKEVMDYFDGKVDSGNKFSNNYTFINSTLPVSKAYYFDRLEASGFAVGNMLFQQIPSDEISSGTTQYGDKIDGLIGLSILRKLPFKFSANDLELVFYKNDSAFPIGERVEFDKKKLPSILSTKLRLTDELTVDAFLDTGAFESIVSEKKVRKIKYKNSKRVVETRDKQTTESYLVWNEVHFANQSISNPILYARTELNISTVGMCILRRYDFYINVEGGYGVFVLQTSVPEQYPLKQIVHREENIFGFLIGGYTISKLGAITITNTSNIGQKYVTEVYYIDGKPLCTTVEPNDELVSINGIPCKDFDWNTYACEQEADFVFKRGKKEIKLHASRQNYIGDETY